MKTKQKSSSFPFGKVIGVVCLLVVLVIVAGLVCISRYDPVANARKKLEAKTYKTVAYDAAAIQGTLTSGKSAADISTSVAGNPYIEEYVSPGIAADNSVSWDSIVLQKVTAADWLENETISIQSCVRYKVFLKQQTVSVTPINCKDAEPQREIRAQDGYGNMEVKLDSAKIQKARDERGNKLNCQAVGEGRSVCS